MPAQYQVPYSFPKYHVLQYIGGSGILASILVLLLQGSYVLTIPSKLTNNSKKKEERKKFGR
jgi:hypothetical protein